MDQNQIKKEKRKKSKTRKETQIKQKQNRKERKIAEDCLYTEFVIMPRSL